MRVLVTGASGFLGRALVAALAREGVHVCAAMREEAAGFPANVEVVRHGDLATRIQWRTLLSGIDCVVHLAGIAHARPGIPDRVYDEINHRATAELAAAAQRAGVKRLVFVSSIRAQSGPAARDILTEADEPRPTDAYGASKLAAERAVQASGVPYTILRPVLVYGPGVKGNFAALVRLAARKVPLPFGASVNRRSLLDRDGLVRAVAFVLGTRAAAGQIYIVADPAPISLKDLITALRRGFGRPAWLVPVPRAALRAALRMTGHGEDIARIDGELIASPAKLIAAGWPPPADTGVALERMARELVAGTAR